MKNWIKINGRSIFYVGLLGFGFFFLIGIIENEPIQQFWMGSIVLFTLLILEIVGIWFWASRRLSQLNIPAVDEYDHLTQLILHVSLPTLFYWSIIGFIFINMNPHIWKVVITISIIIFFILFTNIRSYYEDKFKLERRTHYIYDFIKFFIYLLVIFSLVEIGITYAIPLSLIGSGAFALSFFLVILNLIGYKNKSIRFLLISFIGSIINGVVLFISIYYLDVARVLVTSMLSFYILTSLLHHLIRKDLTKDIIIEYGLVALLSLVMFVY